MSALDRVRDFLKTKRADLRYADADGTIIVHAVAPHGFDVSISEDLWVGYDGWHERFDAAEQALGRLESAFRVAGFDCGAPPVIKVQQPRRGDDP